MSKQRNLDESELNSIAAGTKVFGPESDLIAEGESPDSSGDSGGGVGNAEGDESSNQGGTNQFSRP